MVKQGDKTKTAAVKFPVIENRVIQETPILTAEGVKRKMIAAKKTAKKHGSLEE